MAKITRKRRVKKNIESGIVHIQSTFNNTIVMITDVHGNALAWSSAGALGFKGCLLYTSPSPRDSTSSRMPSSA